MSSKKSRFGCLSALGLVIALTVAGGYAVKKGWHQLLIGQSLTPLSGAKVISNEAIVTSLIYTDSDHWQRLKNLSFNPGSTILKRATSEIEQELAGLNINYQEDIQSWLGNGMIAVIPNENQSKQNVLIVLGIKNPWNAYKFFNKVKAAEQGELEFSNYNNKKINIINNQQGEKVNVALLGNKIVLSDDIEVVKQAIDTYRGDEPSLAEDLIGKTALKQPFKFKNELAKVYITNYNYILNKSNSFTPSQKNLANLEPVNSISFGMGVEKNQLKLQSFAEINPELISKINDSNSNKIINKLPEETIAFISGHRINNFWFDLVAIGKKDREINQAIEGIRTATKWTTGLDLDRDILNWMDGEFAWGIVSVDRTIVPQLNLKIGTVMLLESSDRDAANNTLSALDSKLQQQLGVTSIKKQIEKQTVNQLLVPNSNLNLSYGWLDKNNLLLTLGTDVFESFENNSTSLAKSSDFQEIARELPKQNQGYFYFNVDKALTELEQIPGLPIDYNSETVKTIESIKSIGATSTIIDSDTSKMDMVILFKDN